MATIDVYEQYFEAEHEANGRARHAALVKLTSDSEAGHIRYTAGGTCFPLDDPEDYAVSWDDCFEEELFAAKGRRSKKREATLLERLQPTIDAMTGPAGAKVFWDRPLREARRG